MRKIALILGMWMIFISPFSFSRNQNISSDKILTEAALKEKVGGINIFCWLPLTVLYALLDGFAGDGQFSATAALIRECFHGGGGSGGGSPLPEPCSNGGSPERNWACSQNGGSNMGPVNAPNAHPDDVCCLY